MDRSTDVVHLAVYECDAFFSIQQGAAPCLEGFHVHGCVEIACNKYVQRFAEGACHAACTLDDPVLPGRGLFRVLEPCIVVQEIFIGVYAPAQLIRISDDTLQPFVHGALAVVITVTEQANGDVAPGCEVEQRNYKVHRAFPVPARLHCQDYLVLALVAIPCKDGRNQLPLLRGRCPNLIPVALFNPRFDVGKPGIKRFFIVGLPLLYLRWIIRLALWKSPASFYCVLIALIGIGFGVNAVCNVVFTHGAIYLATLCIK